jgi:hypothetical protein
VGPDVLPCPMSTDITMTTIPSTPVKGNKEVDHICNPSPRHVSDNELDVLQHCLHRWRTEVEQDVRGIYIYILLFCTFGS